jgi:hypothetical protein
VLDELQLTYTSYNGQNLNSPAVSVIRGSTVLFWHLHGGTKKIRREAQAHKQCPDWESIQVASKQKPTAAALSHPAPCCILHTFHTAHSGTLTCLHGVTFSNVRIFVRIWRLSFYAILNRLLFQCCDTRVWNLVFRSHETTDDISVYGRICFKVLKVECVPSRPVV